MSAEDVLKGLAAVLGPLALVIGSWAGYVRATRGKPEKVEKEDPASVPPVSLSSSHRLPMFQAPHATITDLHAMRLDLERRIEEIRRECDRNADDSRESQREQLRDVMDFARELAKLLRDLELKVQGLIVLENERRPIDNIRRRGSRT